MLNSAIFTLERSNIKIFDSPILQEVGQVTLKLLGGARITFLEVNDNLDRCELERACNQ